MRFLPGLAAATDDVLISTQLVQPHRPTGVELLGGDTHFAAKAELPTVGEAGGDINVHGGAVGAVHKFLCVLGVLRDDGVTL